MEDVSLNEEEALRLAMEDKECMEHCKLIYDVSTAMNVNKEQREDAIDVSRELDLFMASHKHEPEYRPNKKPVALVVLTAIAASLVFAVFYIHNKVFLPEEKAQSDIYVLKRNASVAETQIVTTADSVSITVPRGKIYETKLPDGSLVTLNSDSRLSFPREFSNSIRNIVLEGEAYFSVTKDNHKPFVVVSKNANVTVLGTKFNFKDYDSETAEVTLFEGKVHLTDTEGNISANIRPGQHAKVSGDGQIMIKKNGNEKADSWKEGFFYFDENRLEDIMIEIGRWYNVSVAFKDKRFLDVKCHFIAERNNSLEKTITLLNRMEKCHIVISNGDIIVN